MEIFEFSSSLEESFFWKKVDFSEFIIHLSILLSDKNDINLKEIKNTDFVDLIWIHLRNGPIFESFFDFSYTSILTRDLHVYMFFLSK